MKTVRIEPDREHQTPYDLSEEKTSNLMDEIAVAGNTAELQVELGATLDVSEGDIEREKELLKAVASAKKPQNLTNHSTAFAAAAFLRTYSSQLALDMAEVRSALTNKLIEIANCGDPRFELKALELLGKHSDVGLFTERSEITINYKNPEDLENEIKNRVKRLLNAEVIDMEPLGADLEGELGRLDDPLDKILDVEEEEDMNDPSMEQVDDEDEDS